MPNTTEHEKNPNIHGTHVLKSYLKALQIPHDVGAVPHEVIVTGKTGSSVIVRVSENEDGFKGIILNPKDMSSFKMATSLSQLHIVTEAAGYGKPIPIDRGVEPTGRINYLDNFEDVYLRHSIFRRSPNKEEEDFTPYMKVIKSAARRAVFRWRYVFSAMGFDENDLINVGMVYTVSFLHNYASAEAHIDNVKLLTEFLNQRFGEFAKISYKKALNATCLSQSVQSDMSDDREVSYIDTYAESEEVAADVEYEEDTFDVLFENGKTGTVQVKNDGMLGLNVFLNNVKLTSTEAAELVAKIKSGEIKKSAHVEVAVVDENKEKELKKTIKVLTDKMVAGDTNAAIELHKMLPLMEPNLRKATAKDILYARLDNLPQEEREIMLGYAALSRDYCPDTRREARRLADEVVCPKCSRKIPSGPICEVCEVAAVPRFNVDYMAFRAKLEAAHHSMVDAMATNIPESEQRSRVKKPILKPENKGEEPAHVSPVMSKQDREAMADKMRAELIAKLPATAICPKCKQERPKDGPNGFGIRIAKDKTTGLPSRASRQSYCKACRRP